MKAAHRQKIPTKTPSDIFMSACPYPTPFNFYSEFSLYSLRTKYDFAPNIFLAVVLDRKAAKAYKNFTKNMRATS